MGYTQKIAIRMFKKVMVLPSNLGISEYPMFIYFQTKPKSENFRKFWNCPMLRKIRMGWFNPTSVFLNLGCQRWMVHLIGEIPHLQTHPKIILIILLGLYVGFTCNHITLYKYLHDIPRYLHELLGFIPQLAMHKPCHYSSWGCQQWRHAPHWTAPFESLALRSGA